MLVLLLLVRQFPSLAKEGTGLTSLHHSAIETHHSLHFPMDGALQYWSIGGATVSSKSFVRLTPASHSRSGWLLNNHAIRSDNWEMEVAMSLRSPNTIGGDGFGIWVLNRTMFETTGDETISLDDNVLGMANNFNGFGVIFDTYDNDENGKNPMAMVLYNDGSKTAWDHDKDFDHDALVQNFNNLETRCTLYSPKNERDLILILRYQSGILHVYTRDLEYEKNQFCLAVELNNKTKDTHSFAFTALTGAVADIHEIKSVTVQYLDKDSPVVDDWSLAHVGILKKTMWKTLLHWIICATGGAYLCWLSSEEYFEFEENIKGNTSILCTKINNSRKFSSTLSMVLYI